MSGSTNAIVASRRDAGGGLVSVVFDAPEAVLGTYKRPGQYIAIELGDGAVSAPSYFVLACPVGATRPEILLRGGGDVSDALKDASPGLGVRMSVTQGAGFPCESARGKPLIVAVAGTGLAGARSVVAWRLAEHDGARTEVYIGIRERADLALEGEIAAWRAAGVDVTLALSREDVPAGGAIESLRAVRGYVQTAIATASRHRDRTGALLFAIGPDAMIAALRELAVTIGVGERDLHTNY